MRTITSAALSAGLLAGMSEAVNLASEVTTRDDPDPIIKIWDEAGCAGNSVELGFDDWLSACENSSDCGLTNIASASIPSGSELMLTYTVDGKTDDEWGNDALFALYVD